MSTIAIASAPTGAFPPHHEDGRYRNLHGSTDKRPFDLLRLRWSAASHRTHWPRSEPMARHSSAPAERATTPTATWIGHATFLVQVGGLNVLTDPVFSARVGPFGAIGPRRHVPPVLEPEALPPIDLVLLSHDHYDHLDMASLRRVASAHGTPPVLCGLGCGARLAQAGVPGAREMDWGDIAGLAGGVEAVFLPARHWSGRSLGDRRRTLWGAFLLRSPAGSLYFAGDTGYGGHFAETRAAFGPPDIALLPIGAYAPRWFMEPQHMGPSEAVRAHLDLRASRSVAMHHGTFQMTDEGRDDPSRALVLALAAAGIAPAAFAIPAPGEAVTAR